METPRNIIEEVIRSDQDDRRFERFCADLLSELHGIDYEVSSRGGDTGIDAEGSTLLAKGKAVVASTTQRRSIKQKVLDDADKIKNRSIFVARLDVCVSSSLSKAAAASLRELIEQKLPRTIVTMHGLDELATLAFRYSTAFQQNYRHDLDERLNWLRRAQEERLVSEPQECLLEIISSVVTNAEVKKQRELVIQELVLEVTSRIEPRDVTTLRQRVTKMLLRDLSPQTIYIESAVVELGKRNLIRRTREGFTRTSDGDDYLADRARQHVAANLGGRNVFFELLGEVNAEFSTKERSATWAAVRETFAGLFLHHGLRVVQEIRALSLDKSLRGLEDFVTPAATTILSRLKRLRLGDQKEQAIAYALQEVVVSYDSAAFNWFCNVAGNYLSACSLGLDASIEFTISIRMSRWIVIPDTHVVLSYLSRGDDDHESAAAIVDITRSSGAKLRVMEAVVAECLNHAEIADESFDAVSERLREWRKSLPNVHAFDVICRDDNAFVKDFAIIDDGSWALSNWRNYMSDFRAHVMGDVSRLVSILTSEAGFHFERDSATVLAAAGAILKKIDFESEEVPGNRVLRKRWDAQLVVSAAVERNTVDPTLRVVIVSSDVGIRRMLSYQHDQVGGLDVSSMNAFAFICSLLRPSSVSQSSVGRLLFKSVSIQSLTDAGLSALSAPMSFVEKNLRRGALLRRLDTRLLSD